MPGSYRENAFSIIDISQPVDSHSAVFPGDEPFRRKVTLTHAESKVINLTAFTMSPHVGTHADAPVHIQGELPPGATRHEKTIGEMALAPYLGPCVVLDVSGHVDHGNGVLPEHVKDRLEAYPHFPQRVLLKTMTHVRYDVFEKRYPWISIELAEYLGKHGVKLIGLDTPSVDPVDSKALKTHHTLLQQKICWLENLDLTHADEGEYVLIALPLKLMEIEASPVRAVLLKNQSAPKPLF